MGSKRSLFISHNVISRNRPVFKIDFVSRALLTDYGYHPNLFKSIIVYMDIILEGVGNSPLFMNSNSCLIRVS